MSVTKGGGVVKLPLRGHFRKAFTTETQRVQRFRFSLCLCGVLLFDHERTEAMFSSPTPSSGAAAISSSRIMARLGGRMRRRFLWFSFFLFLVSVPCFADAPGVYAITGGTVHPASGPEIVNGVVLIRDGLIEAVGA